MLHSPEESARVVQEGAEQAASKRESQTGAEQSK